MNDRKLIATSFDKLKHASGQAEELREFFALFGMEVGNSGSKCKKITSNLVKQPSDFPTARCHKRDLRPR